MGITDIVLLIIIGVFGIKGLFKGLIVEVFGILGLVLGYVLSFQYYSIAANMVKGFGFNAKVSQVLGFVITFLVVYIVIMAIGIILKKFFKTIQLGWMDKAGGFLFGVVKSSVILGVILTLMINMLPPSASMAKTIKNSVVAKNLTKITPYVFDLLNKLPEKKKSNPFKLKF